ncbi:MAG: glycoside hydrolase family 108 protein [Sphingomonas oligoaromativorans]
MTIDDQIAALMKREGGYVNSPADRGGPTRFGITQAVARAHGYTADMEVLPETVAAAIYRADYWSVPHLDLVAAQASRIGAQLFDIAVNCGVGTAVGLLQRALNVLHGSSLKVDGALAPGGATLTTLAAYLADRAQQDGETVLGELIACFQGERYAELVERNQSQRTFIFGWIRNRVGYGLDLVVPAHLAGAA